MWSTKRQFYSFSDLDVFYFIFFPCLVALGSISSTMLNMGGEREECVDDFCHKVWVLDANFHAIKRNWTTGKAIIQPCFLGGKWSGVAETHILSSPGGPRTLSVIRPCSYWQIRQNADTSVVSVIYICVELIPKATKENIIGLCIRSRKASYHSWTPVRKIGVSWKWMGTHKACPETHQGTHRTQHTGMLSLIAWFRFITWFTTKIIMAT